MIVRPRFTKVSAAIIAMALVAVVAGFAAGVVLTRSDGGRVAVGGSGAMPPATVESSDASYSLGFTGSGAAGQRTLKGAEEPAADAAVTGQEQLIIRNAGLEMRVDDIDDAVGRVRAATKAHGGTVADLSVIRGDNGGPIPLDGRESIAQPGPASASVTIRVAADRLDALEAAISKIGRVVSQSSSANDVTQEHVDLTARLKNLKAEEARLRSLLDRASRVGDLLEIERELSRVRGEIEAMQAQLDYLDRQVARATLTVSMTEPGPVVQPGDSDWGFTDAVRRGIQAAVAVVTSLITVAIALLPLLLIIGVVIAIWRAVRRRRAGKALNPGKAESGTDAPSGDHDR